jgi:hypothetical protein
LEQKSSSEYIWLEICFLIRYLELSSDKCMTCASRRLDKDTKSKMQTKRGEKLDQKRSSVGVGREEKVSVCVALCSMSALSEKHPRKLARLRATSLLAGAN